MPVHSLQRNPFNACLLLLGTFAANIICLFFFLNAPFQLQPHLLIIESCVASEQGHFKHISSLSCVKNYMVEQLATIHITLNSVFNVLVSENMRILDLNDETFDYDFVEPWRDTQQ